MGKKVHLCSQKTVDIRCWMDGGIMKLFFSVAKNIKFANLLLADGKCVIFPRCKQHCKRCRLDKCISIGMDPKWVMTNEEKRIRFKNFFKKKDEKNSPFTSSRAARKRRRKSSLQNEAISSLDQSHPTR